MVAKLFGLIQRKTFIAKLVNAADIFRCYAMLTQIDDTLQALTTIAFGLKQVEIIFQHLTAQVLLGQILELTIRYLGITALFQELEIRLADIRKENCQH